VAQRLQSSAAPNAGAWLTVIPSSSELTLTDQEFRAACRLRLGLVPSSSLPRRCVCNSSFDDPLHFYSWLLKRKEITVRHDAIVRLLARWFRVAGAVVHVEPRVFDTVRLRPDLEVILPDGVLLVDVTVVHPASPSNLVTRALATAQSAERKKRTKYNQFARARGATMFGFAIETFGAFGPDAQTVLQRLEVAAAASVVDPSRFSRELVAQTFSVALQKGNALVALGGALATRAAALARADS